MKKKILLILFIILFTCGCDTNYVITINEDLSVSEDMTALEDVEFFSKYPNSSVQRVVGFLLEPHLDYFEKNGFTVKQLFNKTTAGVNVKNNYDSIEDYISTSEIYKQFGDEISYTEEDGKITLKIKGALNEDEQNQEGYYVVDRANLTLKIPFNVVDHNADSVDEKAKTYTWNLVKGEERELLITFDNEMPKPFPVLLVVFGVIIALGIGLAFFIYRVTIISKKNNEI